MKKLKGFNKANFKAWLESKHPRTRVGTPGVCSTCPLAKFVVQTNTMIDGSIEVDGDSICVFDQETVTTINHRFDLPKWAQKFVEKIDVAKGFSVSAKKALNVLATC